jgi:hypothetical protein
MKYKITETWWFGDGPDDTLLPWDFSKDKYCSYKAAEKALTKLKYDEGVMPPEYDPPLKRIMIDSRAKGYGTIFEIVPDEV